MTITIDSKSHPHKVLISNGRKTVRKNSVDLHALRADFPGATIILNGVAV